MDAVLLQQLKNTYGNVYSVQIKDKTFYIRELRRAEYRYILDNFPQETEVIICQTATVFPERYDFQKSGAAGVAANLADQIVILSNLRSAKQYEELLEIERAKMNSFEAQAETYIKQAFKDITFEEMGNWTMEEFMKHLARAEWALQSVWGLPVAFRHQDEEKEESEETPEPTVKEMGDELRQQGIDPMFYFIDEIKYEHRKPFVEFPLIGGTRLMGNEEVLGNVREQIQRLSKQ